MTWRRTNEIGRRCEVSNRQLHRPSTRPTCRTQRRLLLSRSSPSEHRSASDNLRLPAASTVRKTYWFAQAELTRTQQTFRCHFFRHAKLLHRHGKALVVFIIHRGKEERVFTAFQGASRYGANCRVPEHRQSAHCHSRRREIVHLEKIRHHSPESGVP